MGMPAARIGDMTVHGGSIVVGFPTVLIGKMPAARVGDMHVCPMATPAPVPVPHVGGPIIPPGSPTVLIGGMPAARVGDMAVCVGPPDVIAIGCFTVLIGLVGGTTVTPSGAAGAAAYSAGVAMVENLAPQFISKEGHWIEYDFVDAADNPVSGVHYKFTAPDGSESQSTLDNNGKVLWSGQNAGQGRVRLLSVSNARWSQQRARVGDRVRMTADVEGYESGTPARFVIYDRDVSGADDIIATIEAETQGNSVEAEWEYEYPDDVDEALNRQEKGYSSLEYYFDVSVESSRARSGFLVYEDDLEIELKNVEEKAIPDQEYFLYLPNGEIRKGKLDSNGYKKEERISPGYCEIRFPNLSDAADVEDI